MLTPPGQLQEILQKDMEDLHSLIPEAFLLFPGSVTETMEHLTTAHDENYITAEELRLGEEKCELVFKLINGYVAYLDKSKSLTRQAPGNKA